MGSTVTVDVSVTGVVKDMIELGKRRGSVSPDKSVLNSGLLHASSAATRHKK